MNSTEFVTLYASLVQILTLVVWTYGAVKFSHSNLVYRIVGEIKWGRGKHMCWLALLEGRVDRN